MRHRRRTLCRNAVAHALRLLSCFAFGLGIAAMPAALHAGPKAGVTTITCKLIDAGTRDAVADGHATVDQRYVVDAGRGGTIVLQVDSASVSQVIFTATGYAPAVRVFHPSETSTLELEVEMNKTPQAPPKDTSAIGMCYEAALAKNPGTRGVIVVSWVVTRAGAATDVKLISSTVHNAQLDQCVVRAVKNEHFPPAEGPPKRLSQRFVFDGPPRGTGSIGR